MKKKLLAVTLCLMMVFAFTACGPKSLENYVESNTATKEAIDNLASADGLNVEISGNDVIYSYDVSSFSGVTEELATSDDMKEQLASALDGQKSTFETLVTTLEDETKFDNIRIIVKYTYGDTEIVSQTFEN